MNNPPPRPHLTDHGRRELNKLLTKFLGHFTHEIPPQWVEILVGNIANFISTPEVIEIKEMTT